MGCADERGARRYGLQETLLGSLVEKVCFGNARGRFDGWNEKGGACLGAMVGATLAERGGWPRVSGGITLAQ